MALERGNLLTFQNLCTPESFIQCMLKQRGSCESVGSAQHHTTTLPANSLSVQGAHLHYCPVKCNFAHLLEYDPVTISRSIWRAFYFGQSYLCVFLRMKKMHPCSMVITMHLSVGSQCVSRSAHQGPIVSSVNMLF